MKFVKLAATAALCMAVAGAFAQGGGGAGGGRGFGGGGFRQGGRMGGGSEWGMLSRADVQKDLKVTDDQKKKVEAAQQKRREEMQAMFQGGGVNFQEMTQEERQKMMEKMQEAEKKAYEGILTKEQETRLHEINIQIQGNRAILNPAVQKELKITDEQKKQIADLQTKQQDAMRSVFEKMQNGEIERDQMREIMTKNSDAMNTELGKILTKEQADQLKKMGGAPFKADPTGPGHGG